MFPPPHTGIAGSIRIHHIGSILAIPGMHTILASTWKYHMMFTAASKGVNERLPRGQWAASQGSMSCLHYVAFRDKPGAAPWCCVKLVLQWLHQLNWFTSAGGNLALPFATSSMITCCIQLQREKMGTLVGVQWLVSCLVGGVWARDYPMVMNPSHTHMMPESAPSKDMLVNCWLIASM